MQEEGPSPNEDDVQCGVGNWKISSKRLANMKVFTLNMSLVLLLCVSYTTYQSGSVRTLERRFHLSSTQSGLLTSIIDVLQSLAAGIIGYLGGRLHKPRLMVFTTLITSVGIMLYAFPFFVYGPRPVVPHLLNTSHIGGPQPEAVDLTCRPAGGAAVAVGAGCAAEETPEEDPAHGMGVSGPFLILIVASIVSAQGSSPIYCLGIPYIEENLEQGDASFYVGIVFSMYAWSKLVGLLLAAITTRLPESLTVSSVSPTDPDFIGAWWLGYVIMSILIVFASGPLVLFPKHFKHYYQTKNKTNKEIVKTNDRTPVINELEGFVRSVWHVLTTPAYLWINLSDLCTTYLMTGVISQLPRYLEVHFHQPAYLANILSACSAAISGIVGIPLGGAILKRYQLSTLGAARLYLGSLMVGLVGVLLATAMSCPQQPMFGLENEGSSSNDGQECNAHCACPKEAFRPVCDVDHVTYLNPCVAGCDDLDVAEEVYTNCSCVPRDSPLGGGEVSARQCPARPTCPTLVPYLVVIFVASLVGAIGSVPSIMIVLRMMEPKDKSTAIGLRSMLMNLLGYVPGPLVFGALIDSSCVLWGVSCSGGRGSCLLYDSSRYRLLTHGVSALPQAAAVVCGAAAYCSLRRQQQGAEGAEAN